MHNDTWRPWLRRLRWPAALLVAFALGLWIAHDPSSKHASERHAEHTGVWTCSMHPQIRSNGPGQCPICGMDLVPVGSAEARQDPTRIALSDAAKKLARIRTVKVAPQDSTTAPLELLGRLEPAETETRTVTAWTAGRIDRLHVDVTGARVRKGQVIATLYSPEIYAASRDLELAGQQVRALAGASPQAKAAAEAALASARRRLELLGVPGTVLDDIAAGRGSREHVNIYSPFGGTVTERLVSEGQYVEAGTPLYRLVDLGTLWVQLDAYESDLPHLQVGQDVQLRVTALPGRELHGKVVFVDPVVDPARRTARVRVEIQNPKGDLKPGMFAQAVVMRDQPGSKRKASPLVIPNTAPLFTGKRAVVYVEIPDAEQPTYEAREVQLGPRMGDVYPVVSGLRAGERVVVQGAFVLDADLQIRGGASVMNRGDDLDVPQPPPPTELGASEREQLAPLVERYLQVQAALANDDLPAARTAAAELVKHTGAVQLQTHRDHWEPLALRLREHGEVIAKAKSLGEARRRFEPLSQAVLDLLAGFGNPTQRELRVASCPMAIDNRPAVWVQTEPKVDNSYQGSNMRQCGEVTDTIDPGERLEAKPPTTPAPPKPTQGHQH